MKNGSIRGLTEGVTHFKNGIYVTSVRNCEDYSHDRYLVYKVTTVREPNRVLLGAQHVLVEVKQLAEKILELLHEEEEKRGRTNVPIAALYKTFEKDAPYDVVQQAVRFLVDRDFIAPFSYSLTAKGRRDYSLRPKTS